MNRRDVFKRLAAIAGVAIVAPISKLFPQKVVRARMLQTWTHDPNVVYCTDFESYSDYGAAFESGWHGTTYRFEYGKPPRLWNRDV